MNSLYEVAIGNKNCATTLVTYGSKGVIKVIEDFEEQFGTYDYLRVAVKKE